MTALKSHLLLAQGKGLPFWFEATSAAVFLLIYRLREFPLPAVANRFELRCQSKITIAIVIQNLSLFSAQIYHV